MHPPDLTLGYLSIADVGPLETIEAAAQAGYSAVGIRICGRRPADAWQPDVLDSPAMQRALASAVRSGGLRLSNISAFHLYPDITMEHLLPVLEVSAKLGAAYVVACSYHDHPQQAVDILGPYSEAAAAHGLRLALEIVSYSRCSTLAQANHLIGQVGSPALGYLLDVLHLTRGGSDLAEIARIPSGQICFAQLCDAQASLPQGVDAATEAKTMRLYPGQGALDLHKFLSVLDPSIELEVEVPAQEHRHLPAGQRADILRTRTLAYLALRGAAASPCAR